MIALLAWRNIWRNRRRSIIILSSIFIGVVATIFTNALQFGLVFQMLENQLGLYTSHLHVVHKKFLENPSLDYLIPHPEQLLSSIDTISAVQAVSARLEHFGLISSAYNSAGITIVGIVPERERALTVLEESLQAGVFFTGEDREILLSTETAQKLEVGPGDKIVLMASDRNGEIQSEVATIIGLFETFNSEFDQMYCFVPLPFLQHMLRVDNSVSHIVVRVSSLDQLPSVQSSIATLIAPPIEVLNYRDLLPMISYMIDMYQELFWVIYIIVGAAMIFGIINTMLMAVMERITEFGVLMAIGLTSGKLVRMILLEAFWIGILGGFFGLVGGYLLVSWFNTNGLDLAFFSEGLRSVGISTVVYPQFVFQEILNTLLLIPLIAVVGALYPAWKVYRLQPVEALRFV